MTDTDTGLRERIELVLLNVRTHRQASADLGIEAAQRTWSAVEAMLVAALDSDETP